MPNDLVQRLAREWQAVVEGAGHPDYRDMAVEDARWWLNASAEAMGLLRDDDSEPDALDEHWGLNGFTPEDAYREGQEDARREISRKLRKELDA